MNKNFKNQSFFYSSSHLSESAKQIQNEVKIRFGSKKEHKGTMKNQKNTASCQPTEVGRKGFIFHPQSQDSQIFVLKLDM